jgi:hypothetical protein
MFPEGWPGIGLLLLRATAAFPLLRDCTALLVATRSPALVTMEVAGLAIAALLLAGLFTPVSGLLLAVVEVCLAFQFVKDFPVHAIAAALGISLAMIGPGAWSIDAFFFGRKRIQIPLK